MDNHSLSDHILFRSHLMNPFVYWLNEERDIKRELLYDGKLKELKPAPEGFKKLAHYYDAQPEGYNAQPEGSECLQEDENSEEERLQNLRRYIVQGLLVGVPYSFDGDREDKLPDIYSPDRFGIELEVGSSSIWVIVFGHGQAAILVHFLAAVTFTINIEGV